MDGRHGRNPPAANLKLSPRTLALPLSPPLASEREALDARLEEIEANLLLRLEAKLQQRQHSEPAPLDEERVQSLIAADLDVYNEHVMALIHAHAERGQQQAAQRRSVSEAELWEARGEVCLTYLAHLEDKVASLTAMLKDKEAFEAQILEMKEDVRRRQSELEDELRAAKAEIESQRRCQRQTDDKIRTLELELERERHQHMLSKTQGEVDRVELQYVCNSHEGLERQIDTLQVKLAGEVEARVRCQALLSHLEGARQTDGQAGAWRSGTGETQEGLRDAAEREKKREREREELQTMRKRVHDAQEALKMLRQEMKRQVVAQNRQMLTAVSSMQLDVDTLHSLLAAHFQEVDQQRASCRKSAWQTPSAKFGDFHAALKRHQIALLSGTKLNFDLTTPPHHSQAALLGASGDGKGVERSRAHAGREGVILNFDSPSATALSDL